MAAVPRNAPPTTRVIGPMERGLSLLWAFVCVGLTMIAAALAYWIVGALVPALPLNGPDAEFEVHRWTLTLFVALWGLLATASVIGATRFLFGVADGALPRAAPWLAAGCGIAAGLEFTLLGWGAARFGSQGADPDLIGATAILAMVLVLVSIGVCAQIVTPRASLLPRIATLVAAGIGGLIVASNLPGLSDGIEASSIPLAVMVAASGVYVIGATAFSLAARAHRDLGSPESVFRPDR